MRSLVAVCTIAASVLVAVAGRAEKPSDGVRPEEHAGSRKGGAAYSTSSAFGNALRLARMLNDERVVASLLSARAMSPGATKGELAEMVDALETLGEPDRAARLLEQRLLRFPNEDDTLSQLAGLLTRSGRAKDAIRVWRRVEARMGVYGMNTTQIDDYARALSRTGMQDAAFRLLKAARPTASDDVREFWEDLGALAWQMEDTSEALIAYRKLWSLHAHPRGVAERLMVLAREAGALDEAIAVGVDDFRTNADPSSLLYAAQLQSDKGDWNMVQRTLALGDSSAALFARSEQYWTLRGEAYSHLGDSRRARESFRAAVALNPGSTTAKNALLWDAIDREDHEALARYVDQWRTSVDNEGVSWAAYAVALDKLGRMHEALRFYSGELARNPTDYLTMLEFVDALERTGDGSRAERMRRFAVGKVRGEALRALRKPNPSPEERSLIEQTLLSTRKLLGAQMNERWLDTMLVARGGSEAESASFLIDWCLSDDRTDCARNVLLRDRGQHASQPKWRAFRLQLAVADDDYTVMKDLLVNPSGLDPNDRI
ncbi:MAG TPA: tetratricopeptide repeat protein, partial [Polyangiaceae bacterium]|nr:tetratricopeptide repeat protein [Polyangiaceae bacterium]